MDMSRIRQWESAVDSAELSPITANLPADTQAGEMFEEDGADGVRRVWRRVVIVGGNVGSRWAYWAPWQQEDEATKRMRAGSGPHPEYKVVADKIFNGDAAHFAGMLGVPYQGKIPGVDSLAWVLVTPRAEGPRVVHVQERDGERGRERYERSKEVHDVETGETKVLP